MSDSNWSVRIAVIGAIAALTFTALGTGAFFGGLYAPHYGDQATRSAYRSAHAKQDGPSQIDRDRAGLPYFAERIASDSDPADGTEREKRDLAAQESMSVWAFWMLITAAVSAGITAIGTGFLLWQIKLTRKAVEDTGKATTAMERQNEIAAESLAHARVVTNTELRPWLLQETIRTNTSPTATIDDVFVGQYIGFELMLKNSGRTPAFITSILSDSAFIPVGIQDYRLEHVPFREVHIAVPPGESVPLYVADAHSGELVNLLGRSLQIYWYGRIHYESVFSGTHHETEIGGFVTYVGEGRDGDKTWPLFKFFPLASQCRES